MKTNLNKLYENRNQNQTTHSGVTVSFEDNEEFICSKISDAQAVIGCAPWFTNNNILTALEAVESGVSIILDKSTKKFSNHLNLKIKHLPFKVSSLPMDYFYTEIDSQGLRDSDGLNTSAFRAIGRDQSSQDIKTTFHYKFFVICDVKQDNFNNIKLIPKSVLCGSFNFTENATESREALTFIEIKEVANEFYNEWARSFLLSKDINDTHKDLNPEFLPVTTEAELIKLLKDERDNINRQIEMNDGKDHSDKDA